MLNFVIDNKAKNKKLLAYVIYYLTRDFNDEVNVSFSSVKNAVNIYYGTIADTTSGVYIPHSSYDSINKISYINYKDDYCALPGEAKNEEIYYKRENVVYFNYDIISFSAFLLTCGEEYLFDRKDVHGRFIADYSLRKDKINKPFFDINSNILFDAIKYVYADLKLKTKQFEILLTHDVDSVNSKDKYVFLHDFKELLLRKDRAFGYKFNNLKLDIKENRHLQIDNYIDLENSKGAKSEFYFIEGKVHRLGKRYDLSNIKTQVDRLNNSCNHNIGIHTNYFSYDSLLSVKEEIKAIESHTNGNKVSSCRNHYLRFRVPNTWNVLSEAGIDFDTTLGYPDINGFRAATSRAFIPYDLRKHYMIKIYEVPLIVMDGIVMEKNISFDDKWKEVKSNIDYVIKFNGLCSILWHQRVIFDDNYKKMYIKIMDYVNSQKGKFVLTTELGDRYKSEFVEIEKLISNIEK